MIVCDYIKSDSSYDAFLSRCSREGRRRNPTNWTYDSVPQPQYMHRGYTMHVLRNTDFAHRNPNVEQIPIMYDFYYSDRDYIGKMLDEFGLINMPARRNGNEGGNGRCGVYPDFIGNPVVGRFLSPDIIVQNPNNTQCYNRYSYAVNNPLKYTDLSGWSYGTLDQMHNNAQRASWMAMNDFNDRMQAELNISSVKIIGQNSLKFFGSQAEGTQHFSIQTIANYLSILIIPGLWGNSGISEQAKGFISDYQSLKKNGDYSGMIELLINYFKLSKNILNSGIDLIRCVDYDICPKYINDRGYTTPQGREHEIFISINDLKKEELSTNANTIYHELIHVYQLNYKPEMDHYEREVEAYYYSIFTEPRFYETEKINIDVTWNDKHLYAVEAIDKHYCNLKDIYLMDKYYDYYLSLMKYY